MNRKLIFSFALMIFITSCHEKKKEAISDRTQFFTIANIGMSLNMPGNWRKQILDSTSVAFKEQCNDTTEFCRNLVVHLFPINKNYTLDSLATQLASSIPIKFPKSKVVRISNGSLDEKPMVAVDFKALEKGKHLGGTVLLIEIHGNVATFNFMASNEPEGNYKTQRRLLLKIIDSFVATPTHR